MNMHITRPLTGAPAKPLKPADVARAAFWSLRHPLSQAFRRKHGNTFTLRQLISYAEDTPPEILADYARRYAQVADLPMGVAIEVRA